MTTAREVLALYRRTWVTYFAWARTLLPLAVVVFVPLGLIHAIPAHAEINQLDVDGGIEVFGLVLAVVLLAGGGLLGEVFYAGTVAIALTRPREGRPPSAREVAGQISYGRLIAIDLLYVAGSAIGLLAFVVPGVLFYIYFGLTAPVAEIEERPIKASFRRSLELVRGHFWMVFLILVPLELAADVLTNVALQLSQGAIGDTILDEWVTDTVTNIVLTPFYAVAAVLLTLKLIGDADGREPSLRSAPPSAATPPSP